MSNTISIISSAYLLPSNRSGMSPIYAGFRFMPFRSKLSPNSFTARLVGWCEAYKTWLDFALDFFAPLLFNGSFAALSLPFLVFWGTDSSSASLCFIKSIDLNFCFNYIRAIFANLNLSASNFALISSLTMWIFGLTRVQASMFEGKVEDSWFWAPSPVGIVKAPFSLVDCRVSMLGNGS